MTRPGLMALLAVALAALVVTSMSTVSIEDRRVVHTQRSVYRDILVTDEGDRICMSFRLPTRGRNVRQSCLLKADPDRLVFEYTRLAMAGLLLAPPPTRILIVGLGGGSLPRVFRAVLAGVPVDVVEIDPAVVQVAWDYFDFAADGAVRVVVQDARVFVKRTASAGPTYDLIVLDAFADDYIPKHLITREFLEECRAILRAGGVVVANTFSTSRLYDSESVTYAAVFGPFLNLRRPGGNRVIIARAGEPPTLAELNAGAARWKPALARHGVDVDWAVGVASDRPDWRTDVPGLTDQYNSANVLQRPR